MNMTRHPDDDDFDSRDYGEHDLTVGDTVIWRGSFGDAAPQEAIVTAIEVVVEPGDKYGVPVGSVAWARCAGRAVVLDLSCGHWCYGEQVSRV